MAVNYSIRNILAYIATLDPETAQHVKTAAETRMSAIGVSVDSNALYNPRRERGRIVQGSLQGVLRVIARIGDDEQGDKDLQRIQALAAVIVGLDDNCSSSSSSSSSSSNSSSSGTSSGSVTSSSSSYSRSTSSSSSSSSASSSSSSSSSSQGSSTSSQSVSESSSVLK